MYTGRNHPLLKEVNVPYCYLCGRTFGSMAKKSKDHIIPNSLLPGAAHKPQLWVHASCNNKKKLQDQRIKYRVSLMASASTAGAQDINKLLNRARSEVRYSRLLRTLLNGSEWGDKISVNGQELFQLRMHKSHGEDLNPYFRRMMRGLALRNLPQLHVPVPRITWQIYPQLSISGKFEENMSAIGRLYGLALNSSNLFLQEWDDKAIYFGATTVDNPNRGFLYIEFFQQFGVLADF